jgi:hypothetical protein
LRWSYTVLLQTLGRYLDDKLLRGELDDHYAYGRDSLLHYARWMADHEYCYLERPSLLEYPTETWAAQDMRKSEVFGYAARYSTGPDRLRFLERADHFYCESLRQLRARPTRTLARPMVILMGCGFRREALKRDLPTPPSVQLADVGQPEIFVPQKAIARQRVKQIAFVAAAAGFLGVFLLSRALF